MSEIDASLLAQSALAQSVQAKRSHRPDKSTRVTQQTSPYSTVKKTRHKNIFTPDEDSLILDMVRHSPEKRYSHDFYHSLVDRLPRHTAASIRDRYRRVLDPKLGWVYKNPEIGDYSKVPIPTKTLKMKFTDTDDYDLCLHLLENDGKRSLSFFEEYASLNPRHSGNSYRYRYRKVIVPKGINTIIEQYRTIPDEQRQQLVFEQQRSVRPGNAHEIHDDDHSDNHNHNHTPVNNDDVVNAVGFVNALTEASRSNVDHNVNQFDIATAKRALEAYNITRDGENHTNEQSPTEEEREKSADLDVIDDALLNVN